MMIFLNHFADHEKGQEVLKRRGHARLSENNFQYIYYVVAADLMIK